MDTNNLHIQENYQLNDHFQVAHDDEYRLHPNCYALNKSILMQKASENHNTHLLLLHDLPTHKSQSHLQKQSNPHRDQRENAISMITFLAATRYAQLLLSTQGFASAEVVICSQSFFYDLPSDPYLQQDDAVRVNEEI